MTNDIWFGGSKVNKTARINSVSLSGQVQEKLYWLPAQNARVEDISDDGRILINRGTSNHTTVIMLSGKSQAEIDTRGAWSTSADISADGKTLLFYQWGYESSDGSDVEAFICNASRSCEPVKLGQERPLALSPDGKVGAGTSARQNRQPQLTLLSTSLGANRSLFESRNQGIPLRVFFPDGKQILFTGVEARDDAVIRSFVQDVDTGHVRPLTEEGTSALRFSPDGKRVITLQPDRIFYIQDLHGGESERNSGT
jgi:WD40 repeat protein